MLDLVERFRGQSATFGPDKIYSLMGLVQAGQPSLLEADYTMTPEKIFMQFTVSCLRCYGNLRVLGLAANAELRSAIAADCLTKPGKQYSPSEEAAWIERYSQAVNNACVNRQLFVTRSGKLGIGPWNLKRGDNIAILMGGKTPFVLRKCRLGEKRRYISEFGIPGDAYKLVGEAHVDGMMYYEGNAEERIKSGEVRIVPLHLL
ncbi:unnamed protein product [Alternaria alternata]